MKSLTRQELDALLAAAPEPDRLMLTVAVNHGLRVSELVSLDASNIIGSTASHPLMGSSGSSIALIEVRAIVSATRFLPAKK